jgi:hypothetical protein
MAHTDQQRLNMLGLPQGKAALAGGDSELTLGLTHNKGLQAVTFW